ncbi:hypothetical protein ACFX2I_022967 [Malus domestica]
MAVELVNVWTRKDPTQSLHIKRMSSLTQFHVIHSTVEEEVDIGFMRE